MSQIEASYHRLRSVVGQLTDVADGIGAESGPAAGSSGSSANFPSAAVGQSIAAEWNEIRSLTSQVVGMLGQATHDQGLGVSHASDEYQATDIDGADAIGRSGAGL